LKRPRADGLTAAERGVAHHRYLQHVALDRVRTLDELRTEAARLRDLGVLSAREHDALDLFALGRFWTSELGKRVAAEPTAVRRELEFTARFQLGELQELGAAFAATSTDSEFVVVQGVADLVVLKPDSFCLLDFKTDDLCGDSPARKAGEYQSQLLLYARALARIYRRPAAEAWLHFLSTGDSIEVMAGLPTISNAAVKC
jgi:ATP-dependent helicase/nuclease subunit A